MLETGEELQITSGDAGAPAELIGPVTAAARQSVGLLDLDEDARGIGHGSNSSAWAEEAAESRLLPEA
jgi:hypothetical protein